MYQLYDRKSNQVTVAQAVRRIKYALKKAPVIQNDDVVSCAPQPKQLVMMLQLRSGDVCQGYLEVYAVPAWQGARENTIAVWARLNGDMQRANYVYTCSRRATDLAYAIGFSCASAMWRNPN